jgi:flagellar protein FlgJ
MPTFPRASQPSATIAAAAEFPAQLSPSLAALGASSHAGDAEQFVARFLPEAEAAAAKLGIEPRLLLAQAALETGWGKSLASAEAPANNLFGIKATPGWNGARAEHWTMEQGGAGLERRREDFRAYGSTEASFGDYVALIGDSPRYATAVANAGDAEAYARAVSDAGYATDPAYADKWLSIYNGERLANALKGIAP